MRGPTGVLATTMLLLGCESPLETTAAPEEETQTPVAMSAAEQAESTMRPSRNMRLLGHHNLQGRSAYQPIAHRYGERRILFVGHHGGEARNTLTGNIEVNGLSVLDVTDPTAPELLTHVPATGPEANGTQHVQVCDGVSLPNSDPEKTYLIRTNGRVSYELFDATDPAAPTFLLTIAETGHSARPESNRGTRETHKMQWDCQSGIAYLNGTPPEGWGVTRILQAFDMGRPEEPRHIRDFGLEGWQPGSDEPFPAPNVAGLHQPFVVGNRMYLGYESGGNGVLQILDRDKFLSGNPEADDPLAPTPENLLYPQIARLDMPSYWGVHTAKPVYGLTVPDYDDNLTFSVRDFLIVVSEAGERPDLRCQAGRDVMFMIDITEEDKPVPVSTFQVPEEPGDFCNKGGYFGPHSVHDAFHPGFDKTLALLSYFNAGIRAVDIRNPFQPVEVAYYIPEPNENSIELCTEVNGIEYCDRVISTNNVDIDDRGYIYAVDRSNAGLHVLELTGEAREIVGLD